MSIAKHILMVEPKNFRSNPQTAMDNAFQHASTGDSNSEEMALMEFQQLYKALTSAGIKTEMIRISDEMDTPDALFPNNWFSTHADGTLVLYPMMAANRRKERRPEIIAMLQKTYPHLLDLSRNEDRGLYLEGTGSIVMDHKNKRAYASLSDRTSSNLLYEWSKKMDYETITFSSYTRDSKLIYHTNVMLCVAEGFCILCPDSIHDTDELRLVKKSLLETGHEIVEIDYAQLDNFCGNCLQLQNEAGELFLIMSSRAHGAFRPEQLIVLEKYCKIIHSPLYTIESQGGGSARCMIAELF